MIFGKLILFVIVCALIAAFLIPLFYSKDSQSRDDGDDDNASESDKPSNVHLLSDRRDETDNS